jgi:hypothetical protein
MAVFDAQISAQVAQAQKNAIGTILETDEGHASVSEADVIRLAIQEGLAVITARTPAARIKGYALIRQGGND